MNGILIVAHGSRAKKTEDAMNTIVEMAMAKIGDTPCELAYMEFGEINIDKGLQLLVDKGVTKIKLVPYFLFEGMHIRKDIPEEVAEFLEKHPTVTVTMGNILGIDQRIADVLVDRILD